MTVPFLRGYSASEVRLSSDSDDQPKHKLCAFLRLTGKEDLARDEDAPPRLIPVEITHEYSKRLLSACKQKGCKVHATLTTVVSRALTRAIERLRGAVGESGRGGAAYDPERQRGEKMSLMLHSDFPNGTREQTEPILPSETLGCFVKMNALQQEVEFYEEEDYSDASEEGRARKFWSEASSLTKKIAQILKDGFAKPTSPPLLFIERMYRLFPDQIRDAITSMKTNKVK